MIPTLLIRNWRLVAGGLVALGLVALFLARSDARRTHEALTAEKAAHALDIATWRSASAKATADNIADVRAKEGDAATLVENKQHDLEAQLADARAAAGRYVATRRVCPAPQANSGSADAAGLSETPRPAGDPVATGGMSELDADDVRICTDAVVKARGWQGYYTPLRDRFNGSGQP